jgi:polysaccharide biosynthesis PFTS motif protein
MITNYDLVVAIPYTSPAYIAECVGIDATFYDPSRLLANRVHGGARIGFSTDTNELINIIRECTIGSNDYNSKSET